MATISIEIAAGVYKGVGSAMDVARTAVRSTPTHTRQSSVATSAVEVAVFQNQEQPVAESRNHTSDAKASADEVAVAKQRAEKQAQRLEQSLNKTALKFDVKLFGEEGAGPGAISAFRFQVVEKETGKVVRQFPPEEIMKITQSPEGIFVNHSV